MIPQTKQRIAKTIILLLVFLSLILALTILSQPGFSDNKVSKNQTTEPPVIEEPTENSGNLKQSVAENMNQQQVLDYWKEILPNAVDKEMYRIRFTLSQKFDVSRWEIDPSKKQVIFHIFHVRDQKEIDNLQGEKIENWTILITHDSEFEQEYDSLSDELKILKKKPELKILAIDLQTDPWVVPPEKSIVIWVANQTPENLQLDKTNLRGWNISVHINAGL